jgi:hypothetical protein
MRQRDVAAVGFLLTILLMGCQGGSGPAETGEDLKRILAVVEARIELLAGPEMTDCPETLCGHFSTNELIDMMKYREDVGVMVMEKLRDGHYGAAYLAGFLGMAEAIPIMRQNLLQERYHYGWEGTDLSDERSYLGDHQFPRHMAYVMAIEKISGQPICKVVKLDAAERTILEAEAANSDPVSIEGRQYLAAKWLLKKIQGAVK